MRRVHVALHCLTMRGGWVRHALLLPSLLLLAGSSLASCGSTPPSTISQGPGLPVLHRLDWGFPFVGYVLWSLDGRYIAGYAGGGESDSHPMVISADGHYHYDLSAGDWQCGDRFDATPAWLPDGQLSCLFTGDPRKPFRLCIGVAPFTSCTAVPVPMQLTFGEGAVWLPDASAMVVSARVMYPDTSFSDDNALQVVRRDGQISQVIAFPNGGVYLPTWVPHAPVPTLSYLLGAPRDSNGLETAPYRLVTSTVTWTSAGAITLGPAHLVSTGPLLIDEPYAWSPTGRWVAVRHVDYRGGDKIYLVNAQQPQQTVDVVVADKVGIQMMRPAWSPDSRTLVVFTVEIATSQPYAIDIASYLKSRGLEP